MRMLSLFLAMLLLCPRSFARQDSAAQHASPQPSQAAGSLPQDRHDGMTLSADPYTNPARAKEKFGKANPIPAGILPVEVFLRNDTAQPIHIDLSTIQLDIHFTSGGDQDVDWLGVYEVASAIAHPGGSPAPKLPRFPIGIPKGTDSKTENLANILRPLALDADIVPPMGMIHGFLFFDMNHRMTLVQSSSLYLPDAAIVPSNKPLMFFEVPLGVAPAP
jgi:hypothetical protein